MGGFRGSFFYSKSDYIVFFLLGVFFGLRVVLSFFMGKNLVCCGFEWVFYLDVWFYSGFFFREKVGVIVIFLRGKEVIYF